MEISDERLQEVAEEITHECVTFNDSMADVDIKITDGAMTILRELIKEARR